MLAGLIFSLATGFLVKFTDFLVDDPNRFRGTAAPLAAAGLAGIAGGLMLGSGTAFATLGIAIIAGVLLAGKVDAPHQFTVAVAFIVLLLLGIPFIHVGALVGFAVFGYLDEVVVDRYRQLAARVKRVPLAGWQSWLIEERVLLVLATAVVSFLLSDYTYLLAMLLFQVGYDAARELTNRIKWFAPVQGMGKAA